MAIPMPGDDGGSNEPGGPGTGGSGGGVTGGGAGGGGVDGSHPPDRVRVRFPGISSRAYEHPADRSALVALRSLTGFDSVLKALSGFFRERSHRLMYLASSVRVSERQFRAVHDMLRDGAEILDLPEEPELFVVQDPRPGSMTIGMDRPFVVVTTGMLDLVDAEELRFVIGHELGHVLSGHAVYRTMLHHLIALSRRAAWMPVGYLGLRAVIAALEEWQRKSELSADRAGLLVCQDPDAALRSLMKTAGGARLYEMDPTAFLEQAQEYDAAGDLRDGVIKLLNLEGQHHPFAVLRASELHRWVEDGDYNAIVTAGSYPLRVDDERASFKDEVRATARAYKRNMDESADPLMKLLRTVGDEAASMGERLFNRMGSRTAGGTSGGSGGDAAGSGGSTDESPWSSAGDGSPGSSSSGGPDDTDGGPRGAGDGARS